MVNKKNIKRPYKKLTKAEYDLALQHPKWQKKRLKVFDISFFSKHNLTRSNPNSGKESSLSKEEIDLALQLIMGMKNAKFTAPSKTKLVENNLLSD